MQTTVSRAEHHIWFQRSEVKDRLAVTQRYDRLVVTQTYDRLVVTQRYDRLVVTQRYDRLVVTQRYDVLWLILIAFYSFYIFFSERMLSPVRLSVCRLSVCNVRAPYSGGSNFRQYFYGIRYLGHPLTFTENFMEIVPEQPSAGGVKHKRGSKI